MNTRGQIRLFYSIMLEVLQGSADLSCEAEVSDIRILSLPISSLGYNFTFAYSDMKNISCAT